LLCYYSLRPQVEKNEAAMGFSGHLELSRSTIVQAGGNRKGAVTGVHANLDGTTVATSLLRVRGLARCVKVWVLVRELDHGKALMLREENSAPPTATAEDTLRTDILGVWSTPETIPYYVRWTRWLT
jgi:hypothetical protein